MAEKKEKDKLEVCKVTLSSKLNELYMKAKKWGYDSTISIRADREGGGYGEAHNYVALMNLRPASSIDVINLFEYFIRNGVSLEKVMSETKLIKIK